jgi:hypothetical protein
VDQNEIGSVNLDQGKQNPNKGKEISCFVVLDALFGVLEASPVV